MQLYNLEGLELLSICWFGLQWFCLKTLFLLIVFIFSVSLKIEGSSELQSKNLIYLRFYSVSSCFWLSCTSNKPFLNFWFTCLSPNRHVYSLVLMASLFISFSKSLLNVKDLGGETDMFLEERRMCDIFYRLLSGIGLGIWKKVHLLYKRYSINRIY